jgi:uncharacterized protein involved in outer membrane biogenesis
LAVGGAVLFLDEIVKTAVNNVAPKVTKTQVSVDSVSLGLFSGDFTISGVDVANPKGFSDASVFVLSKVAVDVQMSTLMKDVVVINKIEVDGAEFFYELKSGKSNVSVLMDNINSFLGESKKKSGKAAKADDEDASMKVFVKEFTFTNGKVAVGAGLTKQGADITLDIPALTLKNIGSEDKGAAIAEVIAQGMSAFSASALSVVASDGAKALLKNGSGVINTLKSLFD